MTSRAESAARRVEFTMPRLEKGHCVLTAYSAAAPAANLIAPDITIDDIVHNTGRTRCE